MEEDEDIEEELDIDSENENSMQVVSLLRELSHHQG